MWKERGSILLLDYLQPHSQVHGLQRVAGLSSFLTPLPAPFWGQSSHSGAVPDGLSETHMVQGLSLGHLIIPNTGSRNGREEHSRD